MTGPYWSKGSRRKKKRWKQSGAKKHRSAGLLKHFLQTETPNSKISVLPWLHTIGATGDESIIFHQEQHSKVREPVFEGFLGVFLLVWLRDVQCKTHPVLASFQ